MDVLYYHVYGDNDKEFEEWYNAVKNTTREQLAQTTDTTTGVDETVEESGSNVVDRASAEENPKSKVLYYRLVKLFLSSYFEKASAAPRIRGEMDFSLYDYEEHCRRYPILRQG